MNHCVIEISEASELRKYSFTVEDDWNNLSLEQITLMADWIFAIKEPEKAKTAFFLSICHNLPTSVLHGVAKECLRSPDDDQVGQFASLLALCDRFREFPSIKKSRIDSFKSLQGPKDSFSNFSWDQYGLADAYFCIYMQTKDEEMLHDFLAVIYRKSAYDGEPCHEARLVFEKTEFRTKMALLLNYMGMRRHVIDSYPWAFPTPKPKEEGEAAADPSDPKEFDPYWSQKIVKSLCGPEYGTFEEINNMKAHRVLWLYEELLKSAK